MADALKKPSRYVTADLATLQDTSWLQQQWDIARELAKSEGKALLIMDEIQKISHWSNMVKFLWDQDHVFFGILADEPENVDEIMNQLRGDRYHAL